MPEVETGRENKILLAGSEEDKRRFLWAYKGKNQGVYYFPDFTLSGGDRLSGSGTL